MSIDELEKFLENNQDLEWQEENGKLRIYSNQWKTVIDVDLNKLHLITMEQLKKEIVQGKNVELMTRVTGYFSKIGGWNPGKKGELKDRYRINNIKAE